MKRELIGTELTVTASPNEDMIGVHGRVIDETMNTLVIEGPKRIPKAKNTFTINGETVEGDDIVARPQDRIKR
jgi:ribonuclease P protein subunit POP4